jgi:hypothetical protein
MWSTRILGDVAADGAGRLTRRIWRVEQPLGSYVAIQLEIHDAGLDDRASIFDVDRNDFLETMQSDDNDVVCERSPGQTSAGAARYERHVELSEESDDRDCLIARSRKNR